MTGRSKEEERLIESLPGDLRRIAEVAGLEAAVRIARAFRGTYLYVPGLDDLIKQLRDEKIRKEYDEGRDAKGLAAKYGVSQRHLRRILNSPESELHSFISRLLED
jgi:Mor family transcriptional regulator